MRIRPSAASGQTTWSWCWEEREVSLDSRAAMESRRVSVDAKSDSAAPIGRG